MLAAYDAATIDVQAQIARHVKDAGKMIALSKKYHALAGNNDDPHWQFRAAYDLWIEGGGAHDDVYVSALRQSIVKNCIKRDHMWLDWVDRSDAVGAKQVAAMAMNNHPRAVYEFATARNMPVVVDDARSRMIKKNDPVAMLRYFAEQKDAVGIELVTANVATQYNIPVANVSALVQKLSEKEQR